MKTQSVTALIISLFFAQSFFAAEIRTWTQSSTGNTLKGEYVKMKDDKMAILKINGRETPVPLSMLIQEDQDYIAKQNAPVPEAAKPTGTPANVPAGEVTVTLSGVALNCKKCEENLIASVSHEKYGMKNPDSVKITTNRKEGTVTIEAKTGKDAKAALSCINKLGFYGKSDHEAIFIPPLTKGDLETTTMMLRGVNLSCGASVREVKKILKSVDGVEEFDVPDNGNPDSRFQVQGNFKPADVINALREKGYGGYYQ